MITRDNYEIYIIDYLDKTLSKEMSAALMDFLHKNPDLYEEFEMLGESTLPIIDIEYKNKIQLKKNISDSSIDDETINEWCIAAIEKQLSNTEKVIFENALTENAQWANIYKTYLQTILPTENIKYPNHKPFKLPDFDTHPKQEDLHYWIIAEKEGDLSNIQLQKWIVFKQNIKNIEQQESLILSTFLPKEEVIYENKKQLKKHGIIRYLYPVTGIVAVAALLLLYFNLINVPVDTYDHYNRQLSNMEKANREGDSTNGRLEVEKSKTKYLSEELKNIPHQETQKTIETENNKKQSGTLPIIETIELREITEFADYNKTLEATLHIETITANELLLAPEIKDDESIKNIAMTESNKLTMFKVAQKGVEVINDKIGTSMELDKKVNKQTGKKRIGFSTRYFSITKIK